MSNQLTLWTEPVTYACKGCRTGAITVDEPAEGTWICVDCRSHHSIRVELIDGKLKATMHRLDKHGAYTN